MSKITGCKEAIYKGYKARMCACTTELCNGSDLDCDGLDCHGNQSNGVSGKMVSITTILIAEVMLVEWLMRFYMYSQLQWLD